MISEDLGIKLESVTLKHARPGQARHDRQGQHELVDGNGTRENIEGRSAQSASRSTPRPPTTTARSCRSVLPSSPAALP